MSFQDIFGWLVMLVLLIFFVISLAGLSSTILGVFFDIDKYMRNKHK